MNKKILDLTSLVDPPKTDAIFGRMNGSSFALQNNLLEELKKDTNFTIVIDSSKVKSINDSFIKGMFSDIFKNFKTSKIVTEHFTIDAEEFYKKLFLKNWIILEAIYKNT